MTTEALIREKLEIPPTENPEIPYEALGEMMWAHFDPEEFRREFEQAPLPPDDPPERRPMFFHTYEHATYEERIADNRRRIEERMISVTAWVPPRVIYGEVNHAEEFPIDYLAPREGRHLLACCAPGRHLMIDR